MSEKQRKPWYLNNPELFMTMLLIGCFLVGGSIAFTLSSLFCSHAAQARRAGTYRILPDHSSRRRCRRIPVAHQKK